MPRKLRTPQLRVGDWDPAQCSPEDLSTLPWGASLSPLIWGHSVGWVVYLYKVDGSPVLSSREC